MVKNVGQFTMMLCEGTVYAMTPAEQAPIWSVQYWRLAPPVGLHSDAILLKVVTTVLTALELVLLKNSFILAELLCAALAARWARERQLEEFKQCQYGKHI